MEKDQSELPGKDGTRSATMIRKRSYIGRRRASVVPSVDLSSGNDGMPSRVPVAIVVINYNGAAFLKECLDSIFGQSAVVDEVCLVDDASTDDSLKVVEEFREKGLMVIALEQNVGMSQARMEGFATTTAPLLLFVDGDNVLPSDYVAIMGKEMASRPDVAFTYPGKKFIGEDAAVAEKVKWFPGGVWVPPLPDRCALWRENHCDTCSMIRRESFLAAGGWRTNPADTMFDWDLFLRISRNYPYMRSAAQLGYRVHQGNWSERERGQSRADNNGMVRRSAISITVATVWSGRLGKNHAGRWLKALADSVAVAGKMVDLFVADDSLDGFPVEELRAFEVFSSYRISMVRRGNIGTNERRTDRRATAEFLSVVFNDLLKESPGDGVLFVEDDILLPADGLHLLLRALLQTGGCHFAAVAGAYRSRHPGQNYWIAANYIAGKVEHLTALPKENRAVDLTGTGCLLVLKSRIGSIRFGIEWSHDGKRSPAHDWSFSWGLKTAGNPVMLIPSVVCKHLE